MDLSTVDDLRKLFPYLPEFLQWAVKTAFFLALRPGRVELFSLTWNAFDWRRGVVIIRQGKSGRLKTVIPHPAYMDEAYQRYKLDMAAGIPLVCHRGNGRRVLSYRTAWLNACQRAGVRMRPYAIRHIAATEMLARGADLAAVAAQLGHSAVDWDKSDADISDDLGCTRQAVCQMRAKRSMTKTIQAVPVDSSRLEGI